MRKILFFSMMAVAAMVFVACQESKVCKIHGTVVGEQYEGKRIFLVPFSGPATAETVDSIEMRSRTASLSLLPIPCRYTRFCWTITTALGHSR